jgi:hypothetical protein
MFTSYSGNQLSVAGDPSRAFLAGRSIGLSGGVNAKLVERLAGQNTVLDPWTGQNSSLDIGPIALVNNVLYAAGTHQPLPGGGFTRGLTRWTGTAWERLPNSPLYYPWGITHLTGTPDNKLLVAYRTGGIELYDPATQQWTSVGPGSTGLARAGLGRV